MPITLHLLANAHLDPVWLWDWRDGLNEGLTTCRTILNLMDEDPEMTFIRGEAAIYEHVEKYDPETFARIAAYVESGRWEIVGGTYVQADTNLPSTETLTRHFLRGQQYFESRFGRRARIAWFTDSFGHSAGLPEILAAAGLEGMAFNRPGANERPLPKPTFWWEAPSGAKVMAYRPPAGWYATSRSEMPGRLDDCLQVAQKGGLKNIGVCYGVGNHGGGPTRRHLADIRTWAAAHPEVRVVHSGLGRLFDALREEFLDPGKEGLPTYKGEINFCLRGCYASAAKIKFAFRKTEAAVMRTEKTGAAISAAFDASTPSLGSAWDAVLFNSFHDILPGSSIERALEEQMAWLGGAQHECRKAELDALNTLSKQIDTQVPRVGSDHPSAVAFLVWNPNPHPFNGPVEMEACLDYMPIDEYWGRPDELPLEVRGPDGEILPFQAIRTEHDFLRERSWRRRIVVPLSLPPMGWSVLTMGWVEGAVQPKPAPPVLASADSIENGFFRVEAKTGDAGVQIFRGGKPVFAGAGLSAITVEDPWGAWGGMDENSESLDLSTVRHTWQVSAVEMLEDGPERSAFWVRLTGGHSRLDLTFSLSRNREAVDVSARLFWDERGARLKLVLPLSEDAAGPETEFDVPGAAVTRPPCGEVPGGRWMRAAGGQCGAVGFASDALYGFDAKDGQLRATIVRAPPYASDQVSDGTKEPWRPVTDSGELRFRFLLTVDAPGNDTAALQRLARELEQPPIAFSVPPAPGPLPRTGSLAALRPGALEMLALKPAEDGSGWILRVRETAGQSVDSELDWQGARLNLGRVTAFQIATWRLTKTEDSWTATRTDATEKD